MEVTATKGQSCPGEGGQGCGSLGDAKRCSGSCLFPPQHRSPRQTTSLQKGDKGKTTPSFSPGSPMPDGGSGSDPGCPSSNPSPAHR